LIRENDKPRGILLQAPVPGELLHDRFLPSPDLAFFIEHFWTVRWNLEGFPPRKAETLPHPSIHLVFEKGATAIGGPSTGKFTRWLEGNSFVFSVKFRPAAFYCFYPQPMSSFRDKMIDPLSVFGEAFSTLENAVFNSGSTGEMFRHTEDFLRGRLPEQDANVDLINCLLQQTLIDRRLLRVEQLAELAGISVRNLQRLFSRYLGLSPKWVIARYRLHEALEQMNENPSLEWAPLAADLGYADQAHFIRDFKNLVGQSPAAYLRERKRRT
jgi:AraC-like DNA-binding protein